jgi:polysaccharide export outer membrane protein
MLISKLKLPAVFLMFIFMLFNACVSNKQAVYVQPKEGVASKPDFQPYLKTKRTIKPGDELYIRVKSDDDQTSNVTLYRDDAYLASTDITLLTYAVDEKGYLKYPNAGEIKVVNLTVEEAAKVLEKGLIGFLSNPSVTIKFTLKNVTVLGEVTRPGRYYFDEQEINIFQALGYAGDISYYGNRQRVMVMREDNNIITKNYLDLTNESLIESYYFYIKPNDVIYVEPLKKRKWGMQAFPFGVVLSTLSTLVIILTYVQLYGNQ